LSLLSPTFLFRFHHFSSISPPFIFRFFSVLLVWFGTQWYCSATCQRLCPVSKTFPYCFSTAPAPFLYRLFVVVFTSISFPCPPFVFRFFRVSFPFLFVFLTRNEGGGSMEGAGETEDFDQNPRLTCSKHGRTYDNHKALIHVIWEYIVRFCLK
jgi:hypothetical protein